MRELGELAERKEAFARLGTRIYALTTRPPEKLSALQESLGEGVTLLSDVGGRVPEAYGMADPLDLPERLVRAGTFLVDRDGRVRHRWLTENYRQRPDPDEIVAKAGG